MRVLDLANPINWTHPHNRGLVARYKVVPGLAGGALLHNLMQHSQPRDAGMHGVLTNGPAWRGPLGRPGGFGSLEFDGTNDSVEIAETASLKLTRALTICAWVMRIDATKYSIPIAKRSGSGGANLQYQLTWVKSNEGTHSNKIGLDIRTAGSIKTVNSTSAYNITGEWRHIACTYDRANMTVYFDGRADGSVAETNAIDDFTNNVYIGTDNDSGGAAWSNMRVDDIMIYSRVLSAAEIMAVRLDSPDTLNWIGRDEVWGVQDENIFTLGVGVQHHQPFRSTTKVLAY